MERSKVRDTDNLRTFYLSRFFVDYLLVLREKAVAIAASEVARPAGNKENGIGEKQVNGEAMEMVRFDANLSLGLVAEMAEIDTVRWVVGRMKATMDEKVRPTPLGAIFQADERQPPSWKELQECLNCFTQIVSFILALNFLPADDRNQLLLVDAMAISAEEEDVEVAEILQNRLYYNGDILDSSLQVVSQYKDQSVA